MGRSPLKPVFSVSSRYGLVILFAPIPRSGLLASPQLPSCCLASGWVPQRRLGWENGGAGGERGGWISSSWPPCVSARLR